MPQPDLQVAIWSSVLATVSALGALCAGAAFVAQTLARRSFRARRVSRAARWTSWAALTLSTFLGSYVGQMAAREAAEARLGSAVSGLVAFASLLALVSIAYAAWTVELVRWATRAVHGHRERPSFKRAVARALIAVAAWTMALAALRWQAASVISAAGLGGT